MKLASTGVIISLLIGGAAAAQAPEQQGLAEFAREERQRRQSLGVSPEGIVTSDTMRRVGLPGAIGRVGTVVPGASPQTMDSETADGAGADTATGAEAPSAAEIDDPFEALARQLEVVQALQDEEVRLQLDINRLRAQFMAPVVSQRDRDEASEGMTAAGADLETLRLELTEALELLAELEAAAAAATESP